MGGANGHKCVGVCGCRLSATERHDGGRRNAEGGRRGGVGTADAHAIADRDAYANTDRDAHANADRDANAPSHVGASTRSFRPERTDDSSRNGEKQTGIDVVGERNGLSTRYARKVTFFWLADLGLWIGLSLSLFLNFPLFPHVVDHIDCCEAKLDVAQNCHS